MKIIKGIFQRRGFTLLEMLIVLGIIAIIIAIATVSYSTAQKKSRDSRKKSDLRLIQSALEQYYSVCGYSYPAPTGPNIPTIGCASSGVVILPSPPLDPKTGTPYAVPTYGTTGYQICASLETESPALYCVTNQQ